MRYPQGAEKTLVETCTGREVPQFGPSGKPGLPADVGCVIMNVTSVSTLGKFLKTGIPLVTKRVTVEGDAIAKPQNIEVPIGTLYRDVIEACGGIKEGVELGKIIFGGPMMGGAAPSADFPVLKQNNGLLLFSKAAATLPEPSACIRCGRCIEACPMGLEPVVIVQDFANKDFDALKARCVDLCVACGSCTYACPAKRPVSHDDGPCQGLVYGRAAERRQITNGRSSDRYRLAAHPRSDHHPRADGQCCHCAAARRAGCRADLRRAGSCAGGCDHPGLRGV
mgnify:CR=1 FL=1